MAKESYTVQENGQVTLPLELRQEYGIKKGDVVVFQKTSEGWLIRKQEPDPLKLLDELGEALRAKGITLEEWIESGREIRGQLIKAKYGLDPDE
jgi:bifunctional DNA-binding transcriptional regulator/antitoxin component of YhaV-PrlF toxin-antitoxin module